MKRHALVVGVGKYDDDAIRPLRFAVNDAVLVADRLVCKGFQTRLLANPTRGELKKALLESVNGFSEGDFLLLFFAGRGFSAGDDSHLLLCRDDRLDLVAQGHAGLPAGEIFSMDNDAGFRRVVLLDSAHSDARADGRQSSRALDAIDLTGRVRGMASRPACLIRSGGRFLPAAEIDGLRHGLFAKAIAEVLDEDDKSAHLNMKAFFDAVSLKAAAIAKDNGVGRAPVPHYSAYGADFQLLGNADAKLAQSPAKTQKILVKPWSRPQPARQPRPAPQAGQQPPPLPKPPPLLRRARIPAGGAPGEQRYFEIAKEVTVPFRWCPATTSAEWKEITGGVDVFPMGSPHGESGRDSKDEFQHNVRLTKGFWIAETPVLQAEWELVMGRGENHSSSKAAENPVTGVAWEDAMDFLGKIRKSGCNAALPTEAQWEYACRAGTTGPYGVAEKGRQGHFFNGALIGLGIAACICTPWVGWLVGLCWLFWPYGTAHVRKCAPNKWGVFDMHGNCGEWCSDWFRAAYPAQEATDPAGPEQGEERVVRGMKEFRLAGRCRSASRWHAAARRSFLFWRRNRHPLIGLRLVLNPTEDAGE